ncbi:MAG: hypothetical protein U9M98_01650 [Patescibacteria group bacterium]|nr:hypothetical protein [Patescibacteria group bacterium]
MTEKKERKKIQNIHQALSAAVSSIHLAKRLLNELEEAKERDPRELPGVFGTFNGHEMVTEEGEKYQVPENYASKSELVYGDRLKMIDKEGRNFFKQVERVKRREIRGVLAKKDGAWHVVDSHGSYRLLPAAVSYYQGEEGDEAVALIPEENERAPFAALKNVLKNEEDKQLGGEEQSRGEGKKMQEKNEEEK